MEGVVEAIFIAPRGGVPMEKVAEADAVAGAGLHGDRYMTHAGYWSATDECQVTLIESETLEQIMAESRPGGIRVGNGEHRRNIVTRGIRLHELAGRQFRVGQAVLEYDRPRPPCSYVQSITEPGMTRALLGPRGGICARVAKSGAIREGDAIQIL